LAAVEQNEALYNPTGCPVTHYGRLNVAEAPAGWHLSTWDARREEAPVHTGYAGDHQYFLVTRMADIRRAYQDASVFSNTAVSAVEPDPPYRWIPEMLDMKDDKLVPNSMAPLEIFSTDVHIGKGKVKTGSGLVGTRKVYIMVDPYNKIAETNEQNNLLVRNLTFNCK